VLLSLRISGFLSRVVADVGLGVSEYPAKVDAHSLALFVCAPVVPFFSFLSDKRYSTLKFIPVKVYSLLVTRDSVLFMV
jgi:hypothetical protein